MSEIYKTSKPETALKWNKNYPPALRALNRADIKGLENVDVQARISQRSQKIFTARPLVSDAFLNEAYIAYANKKFSHAEILFEGAQARDPRKGTAAFGLYNVAIEQKNYSLAVRRLSVYLNLNPDKIDENLPKLVGLATLPSTHPVFIDLFDQNPLWAQPFFDELIKAEGTRPLLSYKLIKSGLTQSQSTFNVIGAQSRLYSHLITQGQFSLSRRIWELLNFNDGQKAGPVYDPQFMKLAGPWPYNWQTHSSNDGYSEFISPSGLMLSRGGRGENIFLGQQILGLKPGKAYQIAVDVSGHLRQEKGQFSVRLRCAEGDMPLSEVKITAFQDQKNFQSDVFHIPSQQCTAQKLHFFSKSGAVPGRSEIVLNQLMVKEVDEASLETHTQK